MIDTRELTIVELRALIVEETRYFIKALNSGTSVEHLLQLRNYISTLVDTLDKKEKEKSISPLK